MSTSTLANAWSRELEVATDAARKAADIALRYQPNIVAETKPDNSPVTQADRECERMIARILSDAFPEDGILGEEGARSDSRSGRRWIIPLMERAIMCAAIRCGRISSHSKVRATWPWVL